MRRCLPLLLFCLLAFRGPFAGAQAFDLAGPKVDVHVKRGETTLPIGQVSNLMPGDRLWIHPDLPASQSAHYVVVIAFLRGVTNPPPPEWFTRVDAWSKAVREEGVFVTVPAEAQQAILFLAPETGGDFSTLRNTVRGRPGTFVRASQDLQAASWDRMRLDAFLSELKITSQTDPKSLKERAEMAARSLGIKVDQQCFDRPVEQQASCLSQHTEGMVMDDAATQSRVAQITGGSTADLMNQLSYSSVGGAGAYSPYVGAIVDTAKILSSLHTARYQYIPALALSTDDTLNLRLNLAPSFRDPKSVVVVALPPVGPARMPPLHPVNPAENFCAQKMPLVLPAEGAPLVLATQMAHGLTLHIESKQGPVDVPVRPDPARGGLVVEKPVPLLPEGATVGVVRGKWGFDDWEGPRYRLRSSAPGNWHLAAADQSALVVGREDILHLEGDSTLCIDKIQMTAGGASLPVSWKAGKGDSIEAVLPLKDASPGPVTLEIEQYGLTKPDTLALTAYAEAASIDRLALSAGDTSAVMSGTRLDEVKMASLEGLTWSPVALSRVQDSDQLSMNASASTADLEPGKRYTAKVELRDGRLLQAPVRIDPPRPQVDLLSKGSQDGNEATPSPVRFSSPDDLPLDKRLVFFVKSRTPVSFPRKERIEVAAVDGSFRAELSLADGSLMLEDTTTALAVLEPLAKFGSSAFGPLQARAVSPDGVTGDWIRLGTLVRVPGFKDLRCPRAIAKPCMLSGTNLFLATAISATQDFDNAVDVPPDFTGTQLPVPHPAAGVLYVKLRDDPNTVQTLTLPVTAALPQSGPATSRPPAPPDTHGETAPPPAAPPARP